MSCLPTYRASVYKQGQYKYLSLEVPGAELMYRYMSVKVLGGGGNVCGR